MAYPIASIRTTSAVVALTSLIITGLGGCAEGSDLGNTSAGGAGAGGSTVGGDGGAATNVGASSSTQVGGAANGGGGQGGAGGSTPLEQSCPNGEFAVGVDGSGNLQCQALGTAIADAFNQNCSVYLGWRDSCTACTSSPSKWGYANAETCLSGLGANGTCTISVLGTQMVRLYGLNTGGTVDENDKFYLGLSCEDVSVAPVAGPCAAGELVSGIVNGEVSCTPAAAGVVDYVETNCDVYMGWRDSCNNCTTTPAKWGHAGDGSCMNGLGSGNTCTTPALGGTTVNLFGLNTGGDVDDNDKFYFGFHCGQAAPSGGPPASTCPAGQYVNGIAADGSVLCADLSAQAYALLANDCYLWAGWRDGCTACGTAPSKWGRVNTETCTNGTGINNTCSTFTLGGQSVRMLGINTDGDVDENDKFYVGLQCL